MRVLHYIDEVRLERGGVVRAVLDLTAELAKAGAEVTLLTGDATDVPEAWRANTPGVPHAITTDRSLTPLLRPKSTGDELARLTATADIVHLHTPWDPFNPAVATAARRAGTPYVISVHGMLDDWCMAGKSLKKRAFLAVFGRRLLQRAAWLHFTASAEADQSLIHASKATPFVAPLVLDATPFETLPGPALAREAYPEIFADEDAPRLLFLGRLQAIKGLPTLLEALAELSPTAGEPPHLLLAGPSEEGHDAELLQQARRLGIADRVHQLGMVGGETKVSLYEAADAFVLPSHHENFGIALAEAMRCGMPVLTSKCVNIWPEVQRYSGLVVEHSVEGFAEGLQDLLTELPERKRIATANREAVFEWLDPQRLANTYLAAYEAAVRGEKP